MLEKNKRSTPICARIIFEEFYEKNWTFNYLKGDTDLNFQGNILIYQNEKGDTKVDAYFNDSTIWMTQKSISQLYLTSYMDKRNLGL